MENNNAHVPEWVTITVHKEHYIAVWKDQTGKFCSRILGPTVNKLNF